MHCLQVPELDYIDLEVTHVACLKSEAKKANTTKDVALQEKAEPDKLVFNATSSCAEITVELQKANTSLPT